MSHDDLSPRFLFGCEMPPLPISPIRSILNLTFSRIRICKQCVDLRNMITGCKTSLL